MEQWDVVQVQCRRNGSEDCCAQSKVPSTGTEERNTNKTNKKHNDTQRTNYSLITASEKLKTKQMASTVTWFAAIMRRHSSCL